MLLLSFVEPDQMHKASVPTDQLCEISYPQSSVPAPSFPVSDTPQLEGPYMTTGLWPWTLPLVGFLLAGPVDAGSFEVLRYDEATIGDIQAAFKAKTLTCRMLVQMYLDRIEAYDKKGPALNAIVVVNPDALKVADALDAKFAATAAAVPPLEPAVTRSSA